VWPPLTRTSLRRGEPNMPKRHPYVLQGDTQIPPPATRATHLGHGGEATVAILPYQKRYRSSKEKCRSPSATTTKWPLISNR
jgi:hypothetical protein